MNVNDLYGCLEYNGVNLAAVERTESGLYLKEIGFTVTGRQDKFLIEGYQDACRLKREANAEFYRKDAAVYVRINGTRALVQTSEELFILSEIHAQRIYGVVFGTPSVIIDVGFNVGFASLFFARHPLVSTVYGFEPLAPTFKRGLKNISLNSFSSKINVYNYGLSDTDSRINVSYAYKVKGQISIIGTAPHHPHLTYSSENIELKDAKPVLEHIVEKNKDKAIVGKIDCEGGEYRLLKRWHDTGLLKCFQVLMIEWHVGLERKTKELLTGNGFQVLCVRNCANTGLSYAMRR